MMIDPPPRPGGDVARLTVLAACRLADRFFSVCAAHGIELVDRRRSLPRPSGYRVTKGLVLIHEDAWPTGLIVPWGSWRFHRGMPRGDRRWTPELNAEFIGASVTDQPPLVELGEARAIGRAKFAVHVPVLRVDMFECRRSAPFWRQADSAEADLLRGEWASNLPADRSITCRSS